MNTALFLQALEETFARHGKPEVFNTDQGSQFSSPAFTDALKKRGVVISMGGRCTWRDNVFVERPRRTIKQEVYLRAYDSVSDTRQRLGRPIKFYNTRRPHSALGAETPDEFYFATLPAIQQAA